MFRKLARHRSSQCSDLGTKQSAVGIQRLIRIPESLRVWLIDQIPVQAYWNFP
ncbi:hypothetical protein PAXRUDRAFT_828177 [Paxillus rubicundulus Ve08.2h10]|uniref:Uncharacterized protein n=1 Tax=Paxillus rubicundulus Ve08.2h10 TaxID=930991 RepID=A0A0D0DWI3_9AGAM|nr:hypothetical protein PAXRUDRAFT_828177 [Paxillus rubicundulus Ve08.2h10]